MPRKASNPKSSATQSEQYWPHHLYVPSSVSNLPAFLTAQGWSQSQIDNHQDKIAYVLNIITTTPVFDRTISHGDYINISQTILKVLCGDYVSLVLNTLLQAGVIETDDIYYHNKNAHSKAKGYRITDKAQSKVVGLMVLKEIFAARLAKLHNQDEANLRKNRFLNRVYRDIKALRIRFAEAQKYNEETFTQTSRFLANHFPNLNTTSFDSRAYTSILDDALVLGEHVSLVPAKKLRKALKGQQATNPDTTLFDVLVKATRDTYNSNLVAITKIHCQDWKLPDRPIKGSRIYTNLTNLASEFRQFLYCSKSEQEKLVNIDIKNSQPFLLCLLLLKKYEGQQLPQDVQQYIDLTSSGFFYQFVAQGMDTDPNKVTDYKDYKWRNEREKRQFKECFFGSIFFCKNLHAKNSKAGKWFREKFKNVYELIHQYKADNYRHLALVMQKEEASIILDEVVATLHEKKIWNASIHDSIVCRESQAQEVKRIILDAFQAKYGLIPSVKYEGEEDDSPVYSEGSDPDFDEDIIGDYTIEMDFDDDDFPVFYRMAA